MSGDAPTRTRILAGAQRVLARKGLAATMADVAAAASVSQGLPYRYFSDKDDLIQAVVDAILRDADLDWYRDPAPGSPGARLHRLVAALVTARRDRPDVFLLLQRLLEDPKTPVAIRQRVEARAHAVADVMRRLVVAAQAGGEISSGDPDSLVVAVFACLDGLGRFAVADPQGATRHFPDAEVVWRMLGSTPV